MSIAKDIKTVLYTHRPADSTAQSFLFQCALHYCEQGRKALYISPSCINRLPAGINQTTVNPEPNIFMRIRFLYIKTREKLLETLISMHSYQQPSTVIVVEQLHRYFSNDLEASGIGALLLHTANIVTAKTGVPAIVLASQALPLSPTHFHFSTVWSVISYTNQVILVNEAIKLAKDGPAAFLFSRGKDGTLLLEKVLERAETNLDSIKFDSEIDYF